VTLFIKTLDSKIKAFISYTGIGSRILRNSSGLVVMSITSTLLSFITTLVLARVMGVTGYGFFSFYSDLFIILVIPTQFGMPTLLVRETAKEMESGDRTSLSALWNFSWKVSFGVSLIISLIIVVFYLLSFSSSQAQFYLWGLLLVPLLSIQGIISAILRGLQNVISGKIAELVILPVTFLFLVGGFALFSKTNIDPNIAFVFQTLSMILGLLITSLVLFRSFGKIATSKARAKASLEIFKSAKWFFLMDGLMTLLKRAPILLVGIVLSFADVGVFKIALQMAGLAEFGLRVMIPVLSPEIARLNINSDIGVLQKLATSTTRIIIILNFLVIVVFILFGKYFLHLAFGPEYSSAYEVLMILLVGQLVNSFTGAVETFLIMTGSERETVKSRAISLVVMVVLILTLSPLIGARGAAIGLSLAMIIWNVLLWVKLWRTHHINTLPFNIAISG
jgi:O-antigen/teichoic acid export membrane protein